jgi:mono/diheme cytochrome c family protein
MSRRAALLLAVLAALAGCDDMTDQPKHNAYSSAAVGPGPVPADTVQFEESPAPVPPVTLALLQRGQQRFRIYCTPCHSELGDGRGMIVQRGFPAPPSYHTDRLRAAPVQHFYDVITRGYGVMFSYAARVAPADRWAIAAYIRALQASQDATVASLDGPARQALR